MGDRPAGEPLFPLSMRSLTDCMLCCLAMLLRVSYEAVREAAEKSVKGWETGLSASEAARVAKRLKQPLSIRPASLDVVEETQEGILIVRKGRVYHALLCFHGLLVDPSAGS